MTTVFTRVYCALFFYNHQNRGVHYTRILLFVNDYN